MHHTDPHPLLPALSELIAKQMGLHFPAERWPDLIRGLSSAARESHSQDAATYGAQLLAAPWDKRQIEILARHLTTGETYFFREPQVFEALQQHALPELIQARRNVSRHLRLWSAGCSTGEEAYSLAIMLQRAIPDFKQWNIFILATDINSQVLKHAEAGIYGEWSFRNAPPWLRERYFHKLDHNRYEIAPSVREMVHFSYLNLAEAEFPSPASNTQSMDIIFCRNVMMYFRPPVMAEVVRKHHQALVERGWFVVSPSEISQPAFECFESLHLPNAILHRKDSAAAKARKAPLAAASKTTTPAQAANVHRPPPRQHQAATAPPPPESPYRQALGCYRQGRYREAAAVLGAPPANAQEMTLLARIHANLGELPIALNWCEQAVSVDRVDPAVHYLRGTILQELGRHEEAMLCHKRTLYLDPEFALAQFALGKLFRDQHKPREAARHFANALHILEKHKASDILPEADDLTAGRLMEIIRSSMGNEERAA